MIYMIYMYIHMHMHQAVFIFYKTPGGRSRVPRVGLAGWRPRKVSSDVGARTPNKVNEYEQDGLPKLASQKKG